MSTNLKFIYLGISIDTAYCSMIMAKSCGILDSGMGGERQSQLQSIRPFN